MKADMSPSVPAPPSAREPAPEVSRAGSMTWKIHREVVLLAGWGRAILLQLAHPLVARGVADHSAFRAERWGRARRLHGTLRTMLALTFGTPEEIARAAGGINRIHDRVHGRLRDAEGGLPAGTSYTAHDPALLRWVHATLLDSFLLTYELFVAPLAAEERDRYCLEAAAIEPLLGIPPGHLPRSAAELGAYMDAMRSSGVIAVTETARDLARDIVAPPVPWIARPLVWLARLPTVGLLPPALRTAYALTWSPGRERALRLWAGLVRRLLPCLPPVLRYWPAARTASRRERDARRPG